MLKVNHLHGFNKRRAAYQYIAWLGQTGVTEGANSTLTKSTAGQWNSGAYSSQQASSGNIEVRFTVGGGATNNWVICGISSVADADDNVNYTNIDYGIYHFDGRALYYAENSSVVTLSNTAAAGDLIGVRVVGGTVEYFKNSTILRTVGSPTLNYPLCADLSMANQTTAVITDPQIKIG